MLKNPFKFGSVVEGHFFTNRIAEIEKISSILKSENHLILLSPRRYGKTSLITKIIKKLDRPAIMLDIQVITSREDLAAQLLKRVHRIFPLEKVKNYIKNFRVIPTIGLNPLSNEVDISFHGEQAENFALEDVLNLIEKLWKMMRAQVTNNQPFADLPALSEAVVHWFDKLSFAQFCSLMGVTDTSSSCL